MRLVRYEAGGRVFVDEAPKPTCPQGGLLVQTLACGLCSGELMQWYMDSKAPHVLGHEVCGRIIESQDAAFPVGSQVFTHHHAPCGTCEMCLSGRHVHCPTWKATRLDPGGMAEFFAVAKENLSDSFLVDGMRPIDAALIEPLACVFKSAAALGAPLSPKARVAVVGLGALGLMHLALLGGVGYDLDQKRRKYAKSLGFEARSNGEPALADAIVVCPGSQSALNFAISIAAPGATINLFAPLPPGQKAELDLNALYFKDIRLTTSYSCGPNETRAAEAALRTGKVKAEQVVSDFIKIDEITTAYERMKNGEILKAMVLFGA